MKTLIEILTIPTPIWTTLVLAIMTGINIGRLERGKKDKQ
jgi:hypothetical protein